jgi:hypothetical protein
MAVIFRPTLAPHCGAVQVSNLLIKVGLLRRPPALAGGAREEQVHSSQRHRGTNKKATVQKCTVAKKTQKVKTFNGLQAHFEMNAIFDYVWQ